ncbi:glycosyltransferase family 2 protein [Candidatus Saccharibacteria bacterium]|nr:glycosyltransferase family 2 protein [Candidatus Saccharibacteria bacterium]
MANSPRVLLIVPAFNEEKSILTTCRFISEHTKKYDYVVINDGSTDRTEEILTENHIPHIRLIENLGIGGAVQTGYKYAELNNYDVAIQFDGDGQHDIGSIETLLAPILDGSANMAIGSRFIDKSLSNFKSSALRRVGIKTISNFIKLKTRRRIFDTTSGFRAVDRAMISFFAKDYSAEYPEPISIVSALLAGFKISEVPAKMNPRENGKSSISKLKSIYYMINVILQIITLRRPRG